MKTRSRYPHFRQVLGVSFALALWPAFPQSAEEGPSGATLPAPGEEAKYLAENGRAMTKMMNDMAVKPTGNVDRDFVEMMVPHHQGAIDMAMAVLRHGHNERLKRLAQEIIVTQQEEIAAMRLAVDEPLPSSIPSPTQISPEPPERPTRSQNTKER